LNANYTYIALVPAGANITDVLGDVEEATQYALADALLRCTFSSRRRLQQGDIEYTFISSLPQDEPSDDACENVPDGQDCYVIDGGITLGYLPPQEESDVLDDIAAVLIENYDGGIIADENPDIVALDFIGFTDETMNGGDANGIIRGDDTGNDRSNRTVAGVAVVVSAAVVALAVLALLLFRRRRQNMETNHVPVSQNISGKDSLLDEDSICTGEGESTTVPIISGDSTMSAYMDQDPKHDVKVCGSSMCPACRQEQGPIFLPANVKESIRDISPERLAAAESDRQYAMNNTVDL
jgi:hypothetical protein